MGLLPLSCRGIQRAEAEVAVRLEWAHAEFLGQGLLVVGFGLDDLRGPFNSRFPLTSLGLRPLSPPPTLVLHRLRGGKRLTGAGPENCLPLPCCSSIAFAS